MDALVKELERLNEYVKKESSLSASAQELERLLYAANETYTVAVTGETSEEISSFLNGLFGEEIFPASIIAGTSAVIKIKYGQKKRLIGIFKTGNTREFRIDLLQMLSRDRESVSSFFQTYLEYFILEAPYQFLENIVLLYVHQGEDSAERRLLLEQADDAVWLFCSGSEQMPPAELDVVPIGIVTNLPSDRAEHASTYFQQELAKRKHVLRGLLGVSPIPKRAYAEFIQYLEQSVQNPVQRKKRLLKRLTPVMEELLSLFQSELGHPQYKAHCQRIAEFVNERSKELAHLKNSTIMEIQRQEEEVEKWDFFSKDITTLQQLYDTLKDSPLSTDYTKILPFLSSLFSRISEFKRSVREFEELQQQVLEQHRERLGSGIGKWRRIFAGKQVLQEMENLSRSVEHKHLACTRWREEIKHSQQQMKQRLKTTLADIEQEVYKKREQFVQKAYDAKQKYANRVSAQTSLYEESCRFLQEYAHMDELQRYLQHEFLPFLRKWGEKDTELSSYIFKIAYILARIKEYSIPVHFDEDGGDIMEALQPEDIRVPESASLPYKIQEQVPLRICEEFEPIIPKLTRMKYVYLRPYAIALLFILFTLGAYEIAPKLIPSFKRETNTDKASAVQAVVQGETGTIPTVTITAKQLVVRDSPSLQARQVDTAMHGELYTIHSKQNGWIQIRENEWIMARPNDVMEGEISSAP